MAKLPEGDRPILEPGIARTRYLPMFRAQGETQLSPFTDLLKRVGIRLELPPGEAPYLVPTVPLEGVYATGSTFQINKASLFTNTSKMPGPSFAIPAGPPAFGGTCPASALGENVARSRSILEERVRQGSGRRGDAGKGDPNFTFKQGRSLPMLGDSEAPVEKATGLVPGVAKTYNGDATFVCRSCLTGETKVLVEGSGWTSIDALVGVHARVWSGIDWRETHAIFQGVKPIVELQTSWGHVIRATPDHKVMTADSGMKAIEDLVEDERLVFQAPEETRWPPRAPIKALDPSGHHNELSFDAMPTEWTYDVGLLAGYVLGDGSVSGGSKYPTVGLLAAEQDRGDLARILAFVQTWCPTDATLRVHQAQPNKMATNPAATVRLDFRIKAIAQLLTAIGLDKSVAPELRRAPAALWTATRDGVRGFLSGMFSTDGCVSLSTSKFELSLAAVSKPLLRDIQLLLMNFGIRSSICAYESSNAQRVVQGYRALYKLSIASIGHIRLFAEKIGFWNERKQQKLLDGLTQNESMQARRDLPRVRSVTWLAEEAPVYDLVNVGDERQFVADGITVSNCYALDGNYNYPSKQVNDMLHLAWIEHELAAGGPQRLGHALAYAIQHVNITREEGFQPYFRIHDAGDFFSPEYLEAWVVCASLMTHMRFWAPTRQWVFAKWVPLLRSAEERVRGAGGWLTIRPSVLRIGDQVPMLNGLSAGSGVSADDPCAWVCPVYNKIVPRVQPDGSVEMVDAASCLEANCTMCWDQPAIPVSYGAH